MPAKAKSGRSSLSANQTTSFFLVSGFGSGAAFSASAPRCVDRACILRSLTRGSKGARMNFSLPRMRLRIQSDQRRQRRIRISTLEKVGLSSLNEGAKVSYEEMSNRDLCGNLRVRQ